MNWHLRTALTFILCGGVMRLEVDLQVALFCEDLLANVALKGLHPEVFSQMNLKAGFLRIGYWAQMTSVRLDIAVIHEVGLEMTFSNERIVAPGMHALVGAVICL